MTVNDLLKILIKLDEHLDAEILIMHESEDEAEWYPSNIATVKATAEDTVMITYKDD